MNHTVVAPALFTTGVGSLHAAGDGARTLCGVNASVWAHFLEVPFNANNPMACDLCWAASEHPDTATTGAARNATPTLSTGPTPGISVIGEALIDVIVDADGNTISEVPGGSPLNVAVALGRLGTPTRLTTALGIDAAARRIREHAAASHVHLVDANRGNKATPSATAVLNADGSADYEFDFNWTVDELPTSDDAVLLHTGSLASLIGSGADDVLDLLERSREHSLVSVDPNIRPRLIETPTEVQQRFMALHAAADIVKMSDEDAEWLYPGKTPGWVVRHLLDSDLLFACVTLGARGALIGSATSTVHLPSRPVSVADTIGAGDTYMAGLLHQTRSLGMTRKSRGSAVGPDALRALGHMASGLASRTVARQGANPPWAAELLNERVPA